MFGASILLRQFVVGLIPIFKLATFRLSLEDPDLIRAFPNSIGTATHRFPSFPIIVASPAKRPPSASPQIHERPNKRSVYEYRAGEAEHSR